LAVRLAPELDGASEIFDFGGAVLRRGTGRSGVMSSWRAVGKAIESAIESYDPAVRFRHVRIAVPAASIEQGVVRHAVRVRAVERRRRG
jgi:hypothetical protein